MNTHELSLSIIIPVFNVEKYIRQCLTSVYDQGLPDSSFEVIVINDGTTDNSIYVIQDIINQHSNITVFNQENQGISATRNKGLKLAKGKYIFMIDSDDILISNSLSKLLDLALSNKYDLVVADYKEMNDNDISLYKYEYSNNKTTSFIEKNGEQLLLEDLNPRKCYIWRILYNRDFLIKEKISFIPNIIFEDIPFVHLCFLKAKKCLRIHQTVYIYRRGIQTSETSLFSKKKALDLSIAISSLWEMSKQNGLPYNVRIKLQDDTFVSFSILMYSIVHNINSPNDRKEIIKYLKGKTPDLHFNHGIKQRISTIIYHHLIYSYINLRIISNKHIKPFFKLLSSFFQDKK